MSDQPAVGATNALYFNAKIWTGDPGKPWADSLIVKEGKVGAIGTFEEASKASGELERFDLGGRLVLPGIHDAHIHLLLSGLKFRFECRLTSNALGEQVVQELCECPMCRNGNLSDWIIAGEINQNIYENGRFDRRFLDESFPDRPVYIFDYSIHNALVNTKALELAGLTADSTDPLGGSYVRREGSSELTGELVERGTWAVKRVIPQHAEDVYLDAVKFSIGMANKFGITSLQEASASLPELKALNTLDGNGELTVHVAAHLVWREEGIGDNNSEGLEELIRMRRDYVSEHVRTDFVKCFLDGAPLPPHFTQADILADSNTIDSTNILIPIEDLVEQLKFLDKEGITMKIHCAGEGSVRHALDAIETVRKANGDSGPLHEIAHSTFIHPDDRGRLGKLRAVAEMSPAIWHNKEPEFAGLAHGFKFKTMADAGTLVTVGSDWVITPNPNLFPALAGMLDRGEESVDLETALRMMTINGATAAGIAQKIGSLETGKSADFIVLDRNLFAASNEEVASTVVLNTVFEGRVVHATEKAPIPKAS